MDLIDRLRKIAAKIPKIREHLKTEEATKLSLVQPFINALSYNVFDPTEVCPEFVADVGTKKGEKVDYAILSDGHPIILIECKVVNANLSAEHPTQLYRYFTPTGGNSGVTWMSTATSFCWMWPGRSFSIGKRERRRTQRREVLRHTPHSGNVPRRRPRAVLG
jgi:hypothetical protein